MQRRLQIVAAVVCACVLVDYIYLRVLQRLREPFVYVPDRNPRCPLPMRNRKKVDVVMFVPTPIEWEDRRRPILRQFLREKWTTSQVILIFVFGTKTGERLEKDLDTSVVQQHPGAKYLFTECRDFGDELNNPNGTSSTTCKVYETCVHITKHYQTKYVWRGADDSYINLKLFFRMMPTLPPERLYMGRYRDVSWYTGRDKDLLLERQPRLISVFGLFQFGGYMHGEGYVFSHDVAEFIGTLSIPPHLTWCEDVMVGMWLNPFRITKMDFHTLPGYGNGPPLLVHYMRSEWWYMIEQDGTLWPPPG